MKIKILLIALFVFLIPAAAVQAEKLPMATGEWIPYTSADLKDFGEFTAAVSIVVREMGMEPQYRFYPWRRCYDAVLKGRVWAGFPYSFTKERAEEVFYSEPLAYSTTLFFYYQKPGTKKRYDYKTLKDLKNYRLGGVTGYFYEEEFERAGLEVDYASKELSGIEKLKLGRIDLFPLNELVGWHLIKTHFPEEADRFKTLERPLSRNPLHLIVSKQYPETIELLRQFNSALLRAQEKGLLTSGGNTTIPVH